MTASYLPIQRTVDDFAFYDSPSPGRGSLATTEVNIYLSFALSEEQFANGCFSVPANLDTSGTVTFRAYCVLDDDYAGPNKFALTYWNAARAHNEAINASYTEEDSGDRTIGESKNELAVVEWTETVANLGWVAGDTVYDRISRCSASSNNVAIDVGVLLFEIVIPVTA